MKRVVISGYYGLGNLGDEAVLAGMIASFRSLAPHVHLTVHSADPEGTHSLHGVEAVPRYSLGAVLRTIKQSDLLLSGGGSLLQDVTSARSAMYYLAVILLAEMLHKPVMLYAQGIGPINMRSTAIYTRLILNRVQIASVRDQGSADLLCQLGVMKPRVHVTADPSFALDPASEEQCNAILSEAGVPLANPLLGVAVRPWTVESNWKESLAQGITEAANGIGAVPVFLPMQQSADAPLAEEISARVGVDSYVLRNPITPAQAKGIVGRMSVVIGMRLHALMFAASQAVPSVAISYDPKVTAFASASPGRLPVLDISAIAPDELVSLVETVWYNHSSIRSALLDKQDEWRNQALQNCRLAMELLNR